MIENAITGISQHISGSSLPFGVGESGAKFDHFRMPFWYTRTERPKTQAMAKHIEKMARKGIMSEPKPTQYSTKTTATAQTNAQSSVRLWQPTQMRNVV